LALLCAGGLAALGAFGCDANPSTTTSGTTTSKADARAEATAASSADTRCKQLLSSGLEMMKPESLGIIAQEQQVVDALNNWAGDCGKSAAAGDAAQGKEGSEFADRYDQSDIEHIRNCWLARQLAGDVVKSQSTDLDRIVGLFDLTVRTVALINSTDPLMPHTCYETMLIGRGTPEDRAWVFAELLRQAGFDSVIVRPKTSAPAAPGAGAASPVSRWLVGVLDDKQVYLFDPTLAWPIPAPDDKVTTPTVQKPATLAQVVAHDELLRKLDVSPEKKYPLRAGDLKSPQIEIITSSRYSEPRIKRIEAFLAGNRSATVYTPLTDVSGKPGLRSRVEAAGNGLWKKEDIGVWEYPDKQIADARRLEGDAKTLHEAYLLPFEGPVDLELDMKTMSMKVVTGTRIKDLDTNKAGRRNPGAFPGQSDASNRVEERHDARRQIKSRIAQLQGDYPRAIRTYLNVQLAELPPATLLPDEVQEQLRKAPPDRRPKGDGPWSLETPKREFFMNFRAAEDAKFWMGVCQMQEHEWDAAEETFNAYLRRYGQGGVGTWVIQAAYLHSLCLAESKRYALALVAIGQLAQALQENDYRRPGFQLLSERWRVVRDTAKPAASGAAETPAKEQPAPASAKSESPKDKPTTAKTPEKTPDKTPATAPSPAKTPPATPQSAAPPSSDAKSPAKPK
jgi:hypothetical protein